MASTSGRTLRLLNLLQSHRHWPGAELAARLEVSPRTLRRDVERLRELGYPVEAQRGVEGGYQLAAGASLPPLLLDDDEAVALVVGLLAAVQSTVEGMAEASVQALAKVVQVMPASLRRRVDAVQAMTEPLSWTGPGPGAGAGVDPGLLTLVAQACRDTERLEFAYVAAAGEVTERETEPHRLVSLGRRWYLVAYDLARQDWRIFRLDRISEPRRTATRFAPRRLPAADAATYVRDSLQQAPSAHTVVAVVQASADLVRERIGRWAAVEAAPDESCVVRIHADTFDWAVLGLMATEADFQVEGPPEFVTYAAALATRLVSATQG